MRALVILVLFVAGPARADTKSPGWALGLSVGSTALGGLAISSLVSDSEAEPHQVVPAALLLVTGPSWGHVYTGDYDLAVGGTLLRVVGLAMIAESKGDCVPTDDPFAIDECDYENESPVLLGAGALLLVGTALAEIIDAPLAAQRYNRARSVTIVPTAAPGTTGLALVGTF